MIVDGTIASADIANNAVTSAKIGNGEVTMAKINQSAATTGQVIKWNGTQWAPANDSAGGPPSGPAGGDLTGTYPNPTIANNAVTSTKIQDATIVNADISAAAGISDTKLAGTGTVVTNLNADLLDGYHASNFLTTSNDYGRSGVATDLYEGTQTLTQRYVNEGQAAGGDLTGTYPNPTIAQKGATTGQVLKWTGSAWAPRNDSIGQGDNAWVRGTPDSVLYTIRRLGIARGGADNMLYGSYRITHTNLGVACTTGTNGQNYDYCTVAGGYRNTASNSYATVAGGSFNTASANSATVGGGYHNIASEYSAAVAGGYENTASQLYATVGGGYYNNASGWSATVAGGYWNTASGYIATVSGGSYNNASGERTTVAGGSENTASGYRATVGGGWSNYASDTAATVAGGRADTASGKYATVGGGYRNKALSWYNTVGGGCDNTASYYYSTVAGGDSNSAASPYATVGGGYLNNASGTGATIGGGGSNTTSNYYPTISGGQYNTASAYGATVGGGTSNTASGYGATVGGGGSNTASSWYATVAGGYCDTAAANYSFAVGYHSVVPSGYSYSAAFNGQTATASNQLRCGTLSKTGGSFTIDHPVDPYNKILNHYFVEGPEMLNIYRGSVVLDATGKAEVTLPDYFSALNRNPHIQLTGVGTSDVYVAEDIKGNTFVIGGKPGTKVYWQVTGERADVSAEAIRRMMPVEQLKTGPLAGRMLDDEFLSGCMEQLEREGKAQGINFRTAEGRRRYEQMKNPPKPEQPQER